jgi:pSer/pThr/pTyr-binding forkhead associated (FHA) protein
MTPGRPSYELFMLRGPAPGTIYALENKSLTIGRDPLSDIPVNDPEVSRQHALIITTSAGDYRIQDLGSTNGTFIDGTRVGSKPEKLVPSNAIAMGSEVTFIFREINAVDEVDQGINDIVAPPPEEAPAATESNSEASASQQKKQESLQQDLPAGEPIKESDIRVKKGRGDGNQEAVAVHTADRLRQPQQIEAQQSTDFSPRLILGLILLLLCCCATILVFLVVLRGDWFLRQAGLVP